MGMSQSKKVLSVSITVGLVGIMVFAFSMRQPIVTAATISNYQLISVNSSGDGQGGNAASMQPILSADGNVVMWTSSASNLVSNDTNGHSDIFVRYMKSGTTVRVNVSSSGTQSDTSDNFPAAISRTGRYAVYGSRATTLEGGANPGGAIKSYLHDFQTGANTLISNSSSDSMTAISDDGRIVLGANGVWNTIYDFSSGMTQSDLAPPLDGVTQMQRPMTAGKMSCDGSVAVFTSNATNLTPNDTNNQRDTFIVDLRLGKKVINLTQNFNAASNNADVSCNGQYVIFSSAATNIVSHPSITGGVAHYYLYDRISNTYSLVDQNNAGNFPVSALTMGKIFDDGRVAFSAKFSSDPFDPIGQYIRNTVTQATESINGGTIDVRVIDKDGRKFAISSTLTDLVANDVNGYADIFAGQIN